MAYLSGLYLYRNSIIRVETPHMIPGVMISGTMCAEYLYLVTELDCDLALCKPSKNLRWSCERVHDFGKTVVSFFHVKVWEKGSAFFASTACRLLNGLHSC